MKISIIVPCCDQEEIIALCIKRVKTQTLVPDHFIIVNDHSTKPNIKEDNFIKIVNTDGSHNRAATKNLGIKTALDLESDLLIFIDGDTIPESNTFVETYAKRFNGSDNLLVFGMRKHIPRPIRMQDFNEDLVYESTHIKFYPSDLLNSNIDNLSHGYPMNFEDLRVKSGMFHYFNSRRTRDEKIDCVIKGWVAWSCNFAIDKYALNNISNLNGEMYFDGVNFTGWGYEDGAFGLDALFAGVNVMMTDEVRVLHFIHDSVDNMLTHIKGHHKIMMRYRQLLADLV